MNKLWIIIVAVLLILAFLQCSNSSVEPGRNVARELTIAEKSLSGSGNLFGFKFFKEVARQEKDKNLFEAVNFGLAAHNGEHYDPEGAFHLSMLI